jgi:acetolactate synthase-1/2/3 large subunit
MGFGLPAAIGSCFSAGAPVALIAGDGGFQLNIQELQTVVHHHLPVRMIVLNNGSHGMVRQFQTSYFGARHGSSVSGYSAPSFTAIAEAFAIPSLSARSHSECDAALSWATEQSGPALIEVHIDPLLDVMPKMAFGREFGAMEPDVAPTSFGAE